MAYDPDMDGDDDTGECACGAPHSDEERRTAVQNALDEKHKKGKKGNRFDGPRVHEMYPTHAIVSKGSGFRDEGYVKHGYSLSHGKSGALQAELGPPSPVRKVWQDPDGEAKDLSAQIMKKVSK